MDNRPENMFEKELRQAPIDKLGEKLWEKYAGQTITAEKLFNEEQKATKFCRTHYAMALRNLYSRGVVLSRFTDGKNHVKSVLINNDCILTFVKRN